MKWHWVEGWQEPAAAPWYGPGQEAYALACYVLGIAMHFPAQTITFFQARLDYGIGLLLLLYVVCHMSEGLCNKVHQRHGQETFFSD